MKTSTDFLARFTRPLSPAAVGAMSFVSQDDDEIEETEEEKVLLQQTADTHTLVQDKHASKRLKKEPQTDRSLEGCPMS